MKVSVVLTTYNSARFLPEAVDSILAQDTEDFEFIIVNDGSTDGTRDILKAYKHPSIKIYELPHNCGTGLARNLGIKAAKGEYIAIMDSDDISLPKRLSSQVDFLDKNPEIDFLGTRTTRVAETSLNVINHPLHPIDDAEIKALLLMLNGTAMVHPTLMMRKQFLDKHSLSYPCSSVADDDHSLWSESVRAGARFHNLEEIHLIKRRHANNLSAQKSAEKEITKMPLRREILSMYFPKLSGEETYSLALLMARGIRLNHNQARRGLEAAHKAIKDNRSYFGESRPTIRSIITRIAADKLSKLQAQLRVKRPL